MFGKQYASYLINRSSSSEASRRAFLGAAGLTGLGVVGAGVAASTGIASAAPSKADIAQAAATPLADGDVLNFALNLEYLEAEFYLVAVNGYGLTADQADGTGTRGHLVGGHQVPFKTPTIMQIAREISRDERAHVLFLRDQLGSSRVAFPQIDLKNSFTAAAKAAGLISGSQTFDPFANELNFLLAAFIFEDVGVTAYKGAAPLITNSTYLGAAAGILAAEAYHAATIRTLLLNNGLAAAANKISAARDSLDGSSDLDQGITDGNGANITPLDTNGIAFTRTPQQVLNIVYLKAGTGVSSGGFFPNGLNGTVTTS